jgi:large subunit ribosomal protein L35
MPKLKAHKATLKRFKVTGTGKIKRRNSGGGHLLSNKTAKQKRKIHGTAVITGKAAKHIKKEMMGGKK